MVEGTADPAALNYHYFHASDFKGPCLGKLVSPVSTFILRTTYIPLFQCILRGVLLNVLLFSFPMGDCYSIPFTADIMPRLSPVIIEETGSLCSLEQDFVQKSQAIPLHQADVKPGFQYESKIEIRQHVNGFTNDYIRAAFESAAHSKVVKEGNINIPSAQLNDLGTHILDMSSEVVSGNDASESGMTNQNGNSSLISKSTTVDGSKTEASKNNGAFTFIPLEPFVPASTRLRKIMAHSPNIIVCPGVYDGLSARIAHSVGFEALYMTGAGTTASCLGAADLGIAQLHDMSTNAEMIANLCPGGSGPPVIADMDNGYGGPLIISRAVQAYVQAGVAGFHIEDQIAEKRCGHLQGKEVVDIDTYIRRIRACVIARARLRSNIVIIARTDANQSHGYDECIKRLKMARNEGADMGILEGFVSKGQAWQAVRDLAPWPLCLNSVENGVSPLISVAEAQEMGFRVIIFSFAALAPAYVAIQETFQRLMTEGVTGTPKEITPKTIFQVCGLDDEAEIDRATGGTAFSREY
jgi:methylisocitrate lyase